MAAALGVCRFIRNDFVGFVKELLPAVLMRAGDDKDVLDWCGHGRTGDVERGDGAERGLRGGKQAQGRMQPIQERVLAYKHTLRIIASGSGPRPPGFGFLPLSASLAYACQIISATVLPAGMKGSTCSV